MELREIDPELADAFHRDLHYIHTPRADRAFALFVQYEEMPFSVFQGYDPRKCFDLTRLYSKPGTPGNTSSSMFSLTFKYLRNNTDTQALLSSPSKGVKPAFSITRSS